jgi:thymidylate kinase
MRIAFIGTQCNGKSTLIKQFLERWPMYKEPKGDYRKLIKKKKLDLNQNGNQESQRAILNALIDQAQEVSASEEKHIVFDRCIVDNIVYSLWLNAKGKVSDEFIIDSKLLMHQSLKYYDILFYLPLRQEIKIEERANRDVDPVYREEIDNIFRALVTSYERNQGIFFPTKDCPAVIALEGPPDLRIEQINLYVKEDGNMYGEDEPSLIAT